MSKNNQISYADIAKEADVPTATVLQVLRGGGSNIADDTRERVLETARRLGYLPRPTTQTFIESRVVQIGLIIKSYREEDIFQNRFYTEVIEGIKNVCNQNQITQVVAVVPVDENSHIIEIPHMVIDRQVDGVLAVGLNLDKESGLQIDRYGVPIVLVDAYSEINAYDSAGIANYQGAYEAVSYLISQGHTHIALVGSSENSFPGILERRYGYLQALLDAGISQPFLIDSAFDPEEVYKACCTYFKSHTHPPVTAIFGVNDWVIRGVSKALQEMDIPVPETISLLGFDDTDQDKVDPPLSSMAVDRRGLGRLGITLLINRLQNPFSALIKAALRPNLVVRQSILRLKWIEENKYVGA
jgi:LacI family transcriptional regulator